MKFSDLKPGDKFRFYGGALNMTYLFVGKRVQGKDVDCLYAQDGQTVYVYDDVEPKGLKSMCSITNKDVVLKKSKTIK